MEVHDSDDETCDSDIFFTVVSDDESIEHVTIWGEDHYWVKDNNKRSNEHVVSVKNIQDSEQMSPR